MKPKSGQLRRHLLTLSLGVLADPRQAVIADFQLGRCLILGLAYKCLLLTHPGLSPINDRWFLRDDRTRCDLLMITDLFAHKLTPVIECRLDLRVTRLARRQAHDLTPKQIGTHT